MDKHHDARKSELRIDIAGQLENSVETREGECGRQQKDSTTILAAKADEVHLLYAHL
jgi:hypothetical protein